MLLPSPTSRTASSGKPLRGLTLAALGALMLATTSCSVPEAILSGDRVNVLPEIVIETASPDALAEGAGLPEMVNLNSARMPGADSGHSGGNSKLQPPLSTSWSSKIGMGGTDLTELALPVVGDGRVYTVSPDGTVSAFDVKNGAAIWSTVIEDKGDDPLPGIGGGLALSPEGLVVHAGGQALSLLDAASGDLIWTVEMKIPLRGGPTIIGTDRVAVTDLDGNMKVHLLVSGEELWVHFGIAAGTVLFGAPAPAYANDEIALAGAGGEVSYFDAGNGELLWTDSVASLLPRTPIQNLGDVRAHPVHDGGLIFVIGQSGRIVAFSARNGLPVWERAIAGMEMPWLAGESCRRPARWSLSTRTAVKRLSGCRLAVKSARRLRWLPDVCLSWATTARLSRSNRGLVARQVPRGKINFISGAWQFCHDRHHCHRRAAECRQIDTVQQADRQAARHCRRPARRHARPPRGRCQPCRAALSYH